MSYIEQLEQQVKNNQQAVYDVSQVLTDYVEYRGKSKALNSFMKNKYLGSDAEITLKNHGIFKFLKYKYLQLKKNLVNYK